MSLTTQERQWLKDAGENAVKCAQLLETHTTQIDTLFRTVNAHADKITTIEIRQEECPARENFKAGSLPGSRSDRMANAIAIVAVIIAIVSIILAASCDVKA